MGLASLQVVQKQIIAKSTEKIARVNRSIRQDTKGWLLIGSRGFQNSDCTFAETGILNRKFGTLAMVQVISGIATTMCKNFLSNV